MGQGNNFRARTNGHKSDFHLYAAGKINKIDNKLTEVWSILARMSVLDTEVGGSNPGSSMLFP